MLSAQLTEKRKLTIEKENFIEEEMEKYENGMT